MYQLNHLLLRQGLEKRQIFTDYVVRNLIKQRKSNTQPMGNKFYQLSQTNPQFLTSLSNLNMQPQPLLQQTHQEAKSSKIVSKPVSSDTSANIDVQKRKSQRISKTLIPSEGKKYDQKKQARTLDLIVGIMKKKQMIAHFKVASQEMILRYNNTLIKDIPHPLIMDQCIQNIPYQQKSQPYVIQIQQLPNPGYNMPSVWIYLGQWYDDFPHGIGKIYHHSFKYQGYLNRGIPHLKGRRITLDEIYEGEFQMNKRQGFGRLVTRTQYYYEGDWKNDYRRGNGYQIHRNGCVFEGEYSNDKVYMGSFYMPSKEIKKKLNTIQNYAYLNLIRTQFQQKYYGTFENNKFQGKGDFFWADGRVYQGEWKKGKMQGTGVFVWPNGKRYQGGYINNQKSGFGKFYCYSKMYQGFWQQGKPHGKGKIVKGQVIMHGVWEKGKVIRHDYDGQLLSMFSNQQQKFPDEMQSMKLSEYNLK